MERIINETRNSTHATELALIQGNVLIYELILDVYVVSFQPSHYSLEFLFFDSKSSDKYFEILRKDDVIKKLIVLCTIV